MAQEVDETAAGEADKYAVVNEDLEQREGEQSDSARLKKMQENLHEAEGDEVE
jgi:hypothetical protein